MKVVGDEATLQSSTIGLNKTITRSDVLSIQEDNKMLTQLWKFHNLFKFMKILNGTTCFWLDSIIGCCCLCLIKHPIPSYNRLDVKKRKNNQIANSVILVKHKNSLK